MEPNRGLMFNRSYNLLLNPLLKWIIKHNSHIIRPPTRYYVHIHNWLNTFRSPGTGRTEERRGGEACCGESEA